VNPDLRVETPATNRLSHSTAQYKAVLKNITIGKCSKASYKNKIKLLTFA